MEITLEKIELVKDRTGVSYKEAKEALEKTEGNVVDAIIYIEESIDKSAKVGGTKASEIVDSIKDLIKKGNVSKIVIKRDGEVLINLPVSIGIIGTVAFPWAAVTSALAAFGTKCTVELIKDNGEVVNVSDKASDAVNVAKQKGGVIFDEVMDKGSEVFSYAKEKGAEAWDVAKEKGTEAWDIAKEKGTEAWDIAREKTTEVINKVKKTDGIESTDLSDLDLSDVDLSELEGNDE